MKPAILVTGGAGYIGRHVCAALAAEGLLPVTLDDLSTGDEASVRHGPMVLADARDWSALATAREGYQPVGVVHLAAHSDVAESMRNPAKYRRNVAMAEAVNRALGDLPTVLASSASVYGERSSAMVGEASSLAPIHAYGVSKAESERILRGAMILRLFNVAGSGGDKARHLVPETLRAASEGKALVVHGGGACIRDYVSVEDVSIAFALSLRDMLVGAPGRVVNICSGVGHSVLEVVAACRELVPHLSFEVRPAARPGDVAALVGDPARAADLLGWRATRDLDAIVRSAWEAMDGPG